MDPNKTDVKLCEVSTVLDDTWRKLYEGAFPEQEREPEEKLARLLNSGDMLMHKSLNAAGELVCFTMVSLAPDFSFLAYMATDPTKRSGGYGSKHLKRLLEILKEQYPKHYGLFFEIEATKPTTITLDDEEKKQRDRRLAFYQRAGARRMCHDSVYLTPSKVQGGKEWEGELLCFEFGGRVCRHTLVQVISEIYQRFYCLSAQDPLVLKVLQNFKNCKDDQSDTTSGGDASCSHGSDHDTSAVQSECSIAGSSSWGSGGTTQPTEPTSQADGKGATPDQPKEQASPDSGTKEPVTETPGSTPGDTNNAAVVVDDSAAKPEPTSVATVEAPAATTVEPTGAAASVATPAAEPAAASAEPAVATSDETAADVDDAADEADAKTDSPAEATDAKATTKKTPRRRRSGSDVKAEPKDVADSDSSPKAAP